MQITRLLALICWRNIYSQLYRYSNMLLMFHLFAIAMQCYAFCYCCSLMLIVVVELLFWRSIYSPVDLLTVQCVQYVFLMTFSQKSLFLISVIISLSYLIFCFLRVVTCINSCINNKIAQAYLNLYTIQYLHQGPTNFSYND